MTNTETTIAGLSATIRDYARTPVSTATPELRPLAKAFIQAVTKQETSTPDNARPIADAALDFYRIIQASKDPNTVKAGLSAILHCGRFGRLLATRFVHGKSISLRELAAMVVTFPVTDRLLLAHEMLMDYPGGHDKQSLGWLEGMLNSLAGVEAEELVSALAGLGREDAVLAFPVRQVLMNGLFGNWLTTRLKTGASGEELDELCYLVLALDDPAHAETLAVSMSVGFVAPTPLALHAITRVSEAGTKPILDMYVSILKQSPKGLAGLCLDGIIAQQTPAVGKLLATIRMKMPSLKKTATIRSALLGDIAYKNYLAALPAGERDAAQADAFSALMALAPDFVESLTRTGTPLRGQLPPENGVAETTGVIEEGESCPKPGFFARLFGGGTKTLEKLLPKARNIRDAELPCSRVEEEEIDGRELTGLNLTNSEFIRVEFVRAKIGSSRLSGSSFSGGNATGCTFSTNDFSGADFTDMTFTKCSFSDCDFTGAAFSNCSFIDCRFRNCTLGGSAFLGGKMRRTGFAVSVLAGASFYETDTVSCRFEDTDFGGTDFTSAHFRGVEFINAIFHDATIYGSTFHAVDMPGSSMIRCHIGNTDCSHALFLTNQVRQLTDFANQLEAKSLPNPKIVQPEVGRKVTLAWSRELTLLRREERMQAFNRGRLGRAITSIERSKQVYMRILPFLLDTDAFERKFQLEGVPTCDVWGYTPGLTTLELAKQYCPDHTPKKRRAEVSILAVYAMGSLGTVAQTAKSDIDCWVCYEGDVNLDAETGLKRKLEALGLWAESEFGLEAHFFPMRMEDVRDNRFSSGEDEESSGSAQALLLKEEFYRTALRIAGKNIAWWVTPPGANKTAYDTCIQATRRYPVTGRPRLEDFGHLAPVPPDEYFGGSLWQMVKAVHSPFKSVLKLGLLETYADTKTSHLTLCDRIKHNLFMNRRGVRRTDPYAALFSLLRSYYTQRGDTEAAKLLTESFMFKANLCDIPFFMGQPGRFEDASLIEALFGTGYADPARVCNGDVTWTFDKSLKMGASVRQYMVHTYQRIQAGMSESGETAAMINAEDLTRMGRRIGANFSKKQHKIMRVPFMDTKGEGFPILHLSAEKAPGKKPIWVTRGGSKAEAKKSAESLQLLHRSGDPALMLAWLLANRIYHPKSLLQADRTVAPISIADLQKLMPAMYDFFPFDETFERDINEGLDEERVTRVFFIFNLAMATETSKIEQASVIYTTNWGEMFCRTFTKPGKLLEEHPSKFLAKHLDQPIRDVPDMLLFIPKGSQCKRINLI